MKVFRFFLPLLLSLGLFIGLSDPAFAAQRACGEAFAFNTTDTCACRSDEIPVIPGTQQLCCGWANSNEADGCAVSDYVLHTCGQTYNNAPGQTPSHICNCPGAGGFNMSTGNWCCGYRAANNSNAQCFATAQSSPTGGEPIGVSDGTLETFNQAIFGAAGPAPELTTPRGIISRLLPYLFTFGGLILFIMLLWGGFEMLSGASDPKSQEAGKQRITAALIGFILLFASFWIAQLVERILGVSIL